MMIPLLLIRSTEGTIVNLTNIQISWNIQYRRRTETSPAYRSNCCESQWTIFLLPGPFKQPCSCSNICDRWTWKCSAWEICHWIFLYQAAQHPFWHWCGKPFVNLKEGTLSIRLILMRKAICQLQRRYFINKIDTDAESYLSTSKKVLYQDWYWCGKPFVNLKEGTFINKINTDAESHLSTSKKVLYQ